jgi:hypothetical protein
MKKYVNYSQNYYVWSDGYTIRHQERMRLDLLPKLYKYPNPYLRQLIEVNKNVQNVGIPRIPELDAQGISNAIGLINNNNTNIEIQNILTRDITKTNQEFYKTINNIINNI